MSVEIDRDARIVYRRVKTLLLSMGEISKTRQDAKKIFISAVSYEFQRHRKIVATFVKAHGYEPVEQTQFDHTDAKVEEHLEDLIKQSFAVICIVGEGFGSKSHSNDLISFTQLEYDLAVKHDKLIYVLIADKVPKGKRLTRKLNSETPGQRESQEGHLRKIKKSGKTYYPFKDSNSFSGHVNGIIATINREHHSAVRSLTGDESIPSPPSKPPRARITFWWIFDWLKSAKGIGTLAAILAMQALIFLLWFDPILPPPPPPLLGEMRIGSQPIGATIFDENGVVIGKTPFEKREVTLGIKEYEIGLRGYVSSTVSLQIIANTVAEENVTLEKEIDIRPAKIQFVSNPPNADIIDEEGTLLGKTPSGIEIEAGPHEFKISKPGFKNETISINAGPGSDNLREIVLSQSAIKVQFDTVPPGATVHVRKMTPPGETAVFFEEIGTTPCQFDLDAGPTEVEFTLANHQSVMLEKNLTGLTEGTFFTVLPALTGELILSADPASARIMEGDTILGTGIYREVKSQPGTRKLFISANGYEPQEVELTIVPGETTSKAVRLVEVAQYRVVYDINDSGVALRSEPVVQENWEIVTLKTQSQVFLRQEGPVQEGWVPVSITGWLVAEGGLGVTARRTTSPDQWEIIYNHSNKNERYIWLRSETSDETDKNKLGKVWKDTEFQVIDEYRSKESVLWVRCIIEGWVALETENGNLLIEKVE